MIKTKKGFTLIELLAVIIILALLMAISIPAVGKYIDNSRRKTLIASMEGYVSAVSTSMNSDEDERDWNMQSPDEAKLTETSAFFIPVEAIVLEKGGKNPYGKWVDDKSGVIVTYSETNGYKYYFQFEDSSGHRMEPTLAKSIKPNLIKTTGTVNAITDKGTISIDSNNLTVYLAVKK